MIWIGIPTLPKTKLREPLRDLIALVGAACLVVAGYLIHLILGLVVLGALLIYISIMTGPQEPKPEEATDGAD